MSKRAPASTVREAITKLRKEWRWTPSDIINLLRGGGSSSKGSEYERELCKRLSLWWTVGAQDDVFWRTSGSGARAKVRGRAGADTHGQHGDVGATHAIGAPLIDLLTIEIKRGYSEYTIQDLFDKPGNGGVQEWERWFAQTLESWDQAGSYSWLLITRRDRREAMAWCPKHLISDIRERGGFRDKPTPYIMASVRVKTETGTRTETVAGMHLSAWLAGADPVVLCQLQRES